MGAVDPGQAVAVLGRGQAGAGGPRVSRVAEHLGAGQVRGVGTAWIDEVTRWMSWLFRAYFNPHTHVNIDWETFGSRD